jgi:probable rRNA maturation factor
MEKKLPVEKIKNDILGKQYELSFAFINRARSKFLNKTYRKKNTPTDVLSFPLDKNKGEILICRTIAKIKAKNFGKTLKEYLLFLVIHAMLHLKGIPHGDKMERYELTYYSRYRCRYSRSTGCRCATGCRK